MPKTTPAAASDFFFLWILSSWKFEWKYKFAVVLQSQPWKMTSERPNLEQQLLTIGILQIKGEKQARPRMKRKMKTSKSIHEKCVHYMFRSSHGEVICKLAVQHQCSKINVNKFVFDKVAGLLLVALLKSELFHRYFSRILMIAEHLFCRTHL